MEKQTVTIKGYMGKEIEITGMARAGLMVHKTGKTWGITHISTGCKIGPGDRLQRDCKARMARLLDILPDWSADSIEGLAKAANMQSREFSDAVRAAAY